MANTYSQVYIHFVYTVQNRMSLIRAEWENELYKYITGIVHNQKHKMIAINGMPDHLHMFVGLHPTQSLSDLIQDVKGDSSKWINNKRYVKGKFQWQVGFGAFSYGGSQIDQVYHYIMNQKKHHKKKTFLEEYIEMLDKFKVPYDERYIFKPVE
jgi:putative transposase